MDIKQFIDKFSTCILVSTSDREVAYKLMRTFAVDCSGIHGELELENSTFEKFLFCFLFLFFCFFVFCFLRGRVSLFSFSWPGPQRDSPAFAYGTKLANACTGVPSKNRPGLLKKKIALELREHIQL